MCQIMGALLVTQWFPLRIYYGFIVHYDLLWYVTVYYRVIAVYLRSHYGSLHPITPLSWSANICEEVSADTSADVAADISADIAADVSVGISATCRYIYRCICG